MPSRIITNKSLTSNVATITTSTPHGVSAGTFITVTNVDSTFNGSYTVTGTPQNNTLTYAKVSASVASTVVPGSASASVLYATVNEQARPGYMYDKTSDSWFPIAGKIDTGKNYTWTGTQLFQAPATFQDQLKTTTASVSGSVSIGTSASINQNLTVNGSMTLKGGINVFASNSARDSALPSPVAGTLAYVPSLNRLYIYDGSAWDIIVTANQA